MIKNIIKYFSLLVEFNGKSGKFNENESDRDHLIFILCGLYCLVAILFLVIFGIAALLEGSESYGKLLLGFALVTIITYSLIWMSGKLFLAGHFVTVLMGTLCIYLFYSGGSENTGILWYFVFPPLVIFIQNIRKGIISSISLMFLTLLIVKFNLFDFDTSRYSNAFLQRLVAVYTAITILSCLFAYFRNLAEESLEKSNRELEYLSSTDVLTNLVNRRKMEELMAKEVMRFDRFQLPFSLIILDLDHFKNVNDTGGHQYGDYVIKQVGKICLGAIRKTDTSSRWGGEEFLVLLPGTSLEDAKNVAEGLRQRINKFSFNFKGHEETISASFGVAEFREIDSIEKCLQRADQSLYLAKENGRNCTVTENQLLQT